MINIKELDGIIFDMDGVIFDSEQIGLRCWVMIGERYGLENVEQTARRCIGRSTVDSMQIFEDAYGDRVSIPKLYKEGKVLFHEIMEKEGLPLKSGAKKLLEWLSGNGVKVGLASSTSYNVVVEELKASGLIDHFSVIVGGDMVEHSKPQPDIYLLACEKLGVRPEFTAAVEDSRNGIISAHRAGMKPLLVPDLIEPDEEMLKLAEKKFGSLDELLDELRTADV